MAAYICYLVLAGMQIPLFFKENLLRKRSFDMKGYLILCCAELIVLTGIRGYTIGADTKTYLQAIDYYGQMPALQLIRAKLVYPFDFEIGYFLLTKLVCLLGIGKTGFLFIVSLMIYIPVFILIKKYSPMPYVSILCYFAFGFFSYSLGIFRQMIAISILFFGWNYITERKFLKYLAVVLFASTFHMTALSAIFLYFLYWIKWKRAVVWIVPIEVALLIFGRYVVLLLVRLFPQYAGYIGGKYDVQGGSYLMLLLLNVLLIASILLKDKDQEDTRDSVTTCALFLAICTQCLGYSLGILGRAVSYFSIYIILAIPNIIRSLENRFEHRFRTLASLVAVLCLFAFVYFEFDGNKYVVPYVTFWS